jgi:histidyl-tRNA synthetase
VKLIWLRALDKLDRLGREGVALLLGAGRKDESGDFTKGAGLSDKQIEASLGFATATVMDAQYVSGSKSGEEGLRDLEAMQALFAAAGYGAIAFAMIHPSCAASNITPAPSSNANC